MLGYSKKEIVKKLAKYFNADVYQDKDDYDNEYYVIYPNEERHIEVVDTKTAIKNEEDFASNKNEFLWEVIDSLIDFDCEPRIIGAYIRIGRNLYYREY